METITGTDTGKSILTFVDPFLAIFVRTSARNPAGMTASTTQRSSGVLCKAQLGVREGPAKHPVGPPTGREGGRLEVFLGPQKRPKNPQLSCKRRGSCLLGTPVLNQLAGQKAPQKHALRLEVRIFMSFLSLGLASI